MSRNIQPVARVLGTYVREEDGKVVVQLGVAGRPRGDFDVELIEPVPVVPGAERRGKWQHEHTEECWDLHKPRVCICGKETE